MDEMFYNALELNNQKNLWLPSIFQFKRTVHNLNHPSILMNVKLYLLLFLEVARQKLFRNNNKNNFTFICCKFLANLCRFSEILEQCHVKWCLKYRNNRSVSWRLSCTVQICLFGDLISFFINQILSYLTSFRFSFGWVIKLPLQLSSASKKRYR